ncbi:MAG: tetratricopeptide repeat protein [Treponema sp.]|nr:tetratricopeptide repeat protein [Treponema sp.]
MDKAEGCRFLNEAYDKLKDSDTDSALALLDRALNYDYENKEIKYTLKCVHWWLEHSRRIDSIDNLYGKGAFLFSLFKQYYVFLDHLNQTSEKPQTQSEQQAEFEQSQYAVRYFVYSKALFFFKELLSNPANQTDHGLLLLTGRCYKGMGDYDEALKYLEQAFSIKKEDAETLAQLADVNALLAQPKHAKVLFREAFFIDPSKIDLRALESALILKLLDKVAQLGYKDKTLCEWVPIYGCLWKVFNVKRELKQMEVGRLKQSIFTMEAEMDANPAWKEQLKPRLLNRYFWLIDYYEAANENPSAIEETLLKIKVTDPDIYNMYIG